VFARRAKINEYADGQTSCVFAQYIFTETYGGRNLSVFACRPKINEYADGQTSCVFAHAVGCYLSQSNVSKSCRSQEKSLKGVTLTLASQEYEILKSHVANVTSLGTKHFVIIFSQLFSLRS
jgi:hypothetical protein